MIEWIRENERLLAGIGVLSLIFFVGSLALTPLLVARIPADYFAREEAPRFDWEKRRPLLYLAFRVARNSIGALLVLLGIAMLILPGQGILTIAVGLLLVEFPGKRRFELALIRRRRVRRAIDWIRARAGRAPLRVLEAPPDEEPRAERPEDEAPRKR